MIHASEILFEYGLHTIRSHLNRILVCFLSHMPFFSADLFLSLGKTIYYSRNYNGLSLINEYSIVNAYCFYSPIGYFNLCCHREAVPILPPFSFNTQVAKSNGKSEISFNRFPLINVSRRAFASPPILSTTFLSS